MPDWNHVHAELRGHPAPAVGEEYRLGQPDGYGYSRFCDLFVEWRPGVSATMRRTHVAGERLFVDDAGDTVPVFDGASGEERPAHVFVAVLDASNHTYAEARWSEGSPTGSARTSTRCHFWTGHPSSWSATTSGLV